MSFRALPGLGTPLARAAIMEPRNRIRDAGEMRAHLHNLLIEALRNGGRIRVAGRILMLLNPKLFRLTDAPFMAQGIVVAGDAVEELRICGNRIEDANDGIRIAASSTADPAGRPWRDRPPANAVADAVVTENSIALRPMSSASPAFGIFFGHGDRLIAGRNSIRGTGPAVDGQIVSPHFGICQYGWRGELLSFAENRVTTLTNGLAVIPRLREAAPGIWRLRDNCAQRTRRAYVVAQGVMIA